MYIYIIYIYMCVLISYFEIFRDLFICHTSRTIKGSATVRVPDCPWCAGRHSFDWNGVALNGEDPISDFLVVELRPYVKANCPWPGEEGDGREFARLDGPLMWSPGTGDYDVKARTWGGSDQEL